MPIYEFECKKCKEEFEELVFNTREPIHCPKCKSKQVKKLMSVAAIKTSAGFKAATRSGGDGGCGSCSGGGGSCGSCGSGGGGGHGHCGHGH
jgi:putative FmdB family regulatory protein